MQFEVYRLVVAAVETSRSTELINDGAVLFLRVKMVFCVKRTYSSRLVNIE